MDKSVLRKATEDKEDPTPGYLFREIVQMTMVDQTTQGKVMAFLMERLNPKSSVHVLAKTLKIVKHLCLEGHADFQKEMQRKSDQLKQFANYRGIQDAKYGDKLNERVRQNAKEAIDAAFSHRRESKVTVGSGQGSDATTDDANKGFRTGSSVGATAVVPGGNAHMAPMPTTNKWAEAMASKNQGATPNAWTKDVKDAVNTGFGLWKENPKSFDERAKASEFGGDSAFQPVDLPSAGFGSSSTAEASGGWKFAQEQEGPSASGAAPKQEIKMLTPLQKEVEKLCMAKNSPQRVELSAFTTSVTDVIDSDESSTWEDLAAALDARLAQKYPWQQRLNCLTAVDHVLRNSNDEFKDYFLENPEDIQRNVHVVQSSLKEKAQRILKFLGIADKSQAKAEQAASSLPAQGGHTEMVWGTSISSTPPASTAATDDLDFGGMNVKAGGRRGRASSNADKTKLKGRRAMATAQQQEEEGDAQLQVAEAMRAQQAAAEEQRLEQEAAQRKAERLNKKNARTAAMSAFDTEPTPTPAPTNTAAADDWGGSWEPSSNNASAEASWDVPAPTAQRSAAPAAPKPSNDPFDGLFGEQSSAAPSSQPTSKPAPSHSDPNSLFDDPKPAPKQPVMPPGPAPVTTQGGMNPQMAAMVQQQMQQMQQMMDAMKNVQDPAMLAQMQQMMAQSQQMINTMMAASAQPAHPPPTSHNLNGSFGSQPLVNTTAIPPARSGAEVRSVEEQQNNQRRMNSQFANLGAELRSTMKQ